jgi:DNA-binding NarL/FixJ family response regulator
MSIRVLLADDHEIVRDGIRALLDDEPGIEVVGEARDGNEALRRVRETAPDVVVMDVTMPGMNGIDATREICAAQPETKVLFLSMHSENHYVTRVFDAGAAGYLLKECALNELVRAIRSVSSGQVYVSPAVAGAVVEAFRLGMPERGTSALSALTAREREVLRLIADGLSTREIADRLQVSHKTVGTHRERIMHKLDLHSIAELTKFAIREGLTSPDD